MELGEVVVGGVVVGWEVVGGVVGEGVVELFKLVVEGCWFLGFEVFGVGEVG